MTVGISERQREIERVSLTSVRWRRRLWLFEIGLVAVSLLWWLSDQFLTTNSEGLWACPFLAAFVLAPAIIVISGYLKSWDRPWAIVNCLLLGKCEHCKADISKLMPAVDEIQRVECPQCGQMTQISRPPNGVY